MSATAIPLREMTPSAKKRLPALCSAPANTRPTAIAFEIPQLKICSEP
jgi:hypothetical protein